MNGLADAAPKRPLLRRFRPVALITSTRTTKAPSWAPATAAAGSSPAAAAAASSPFAPFLPLAPAAAPAAALGSRWRRTASWYVSPKTAWKASSSRPPSVMSGRRASGRPLGTMAASQRSGGATSRTASTKPSSVKMRSMSSGTGGASAFATKRSARSAWSTTFVSMPGRSESA